MTPFLPLLLLLALVLLGGYGGAKSRPVPKGTFKPYTVKGKTYHPLQDGDGYQEQGLASWYGDDFHGRPTASGERFDMHALTAAHKILPMQTEVRVENLENGRSLVVRVNDRGPFVQQRIIDLSHAAAKELGMLGKGTARVRIASVRGVPGYAQGDMPGTFHVQVGAFLRPENAATQLAELTAAGHAQSRVVEALVGGQRFWRVQAGAWPSLSAAQAAARTLAGTYPACFVIAD